VPSQQRYLFVTLGHIESDFYGRVGARIRSAGHQVTHLTFSRRAAQQLRRHGFEAVCMPDLIAELGDIGDAEAHAARMANAYNTPTFRDIYRTDYVCDGRPEPWCVDRTVRHMLAMEMLFERLRPDVIVPEVGNETIRTAAHLVALRRYVPVLFLFYTIFPDPLRLYVDTMQAPIVPLEELRPLLPEEERRLDAFMTEFKQRNMPIRAYREAPVTFRRVRVLMRHLAVKVVWDRDNDYLHPLRWTLGAFRELLRRRLATRFYQEHDQSRPYVYFPLHMVDDYKLKRVVPHCADQLAIVEHVARALPHGTDLVVKEHPMSIGRNTLTMLRRLRRMRNVQLVSPGTSSHALVAASQGVVVVSSTVGLEAMLHGKPVLTLGRPFYSGFGVTIDLDGLAGIREAVPVMLADQPDPERTRQFLMAAWRSCMPGAPVLVDRSDVNAATLARSLVKAGWLVIASRAVSRESRDRSPGQPETLV